MQRQPKFASLSDETDEKPLQQFSSCIKFIQWKVLENIEIKYEN